MNKAFLTLLFLLAAVTLHAQEAKLAGYQYWLDFDHQSPKEGTMNGGDTETLQLTLDMDTVGEGIHTLRVRFADTEGLWSAPLSWMFMRVPNAVTRTVTGVEYWFDQNRAESQTLAMESTTLSFVADASALKEGMHTLAYQIKDSENYWSPVSQWTFYKTTVLPADSIDAIEYWVDTLYTQKVSIPATRGTNTFQIETSGLKEGIHTLSYRTRTNLGRYSSAGVWMFFKTSETPAATGIKWYRYWWNDRTDMAVTEELDSVTQPYALNCRLTVPDYARTGFAGDALTARLTVVFGDDAGGVSAPVFADVKFPDINPPVSQIEADKTMAYTSVNISWSGTDEELKDFNIYVSENDLPFVLWLPNTTATSAVFKGEPGKTYRFTVTARDRSNNVERFDESKCVRVKFNE